MNEPKRWMEESPPEIIEQLLRAASSEQPSQASLSRSLVKLGIGVGAASAAGTANAAALLTAGKATGLASSGIFLKVTLVVAALGGAGAVTAVVGGFRPAARPAPSTGARSAEAARVMASAPFERSVPAADALADTLKTSAVPAQPVNSARTPPAREQAAAKEQAPVDVERLAEEVRAVDRARELVASGRASEAITALDEYERHFSERKFAPEALYLKMEALLASGQTALAKNVAARFIAAYPKSPQAPRARQVLARSNP